MIPPAAAPAPGPVPDTAKRVQLSRAAGARLPPDAVRCDRSTAFGNPFEVRGSVSHLDGRWWVERDDGRTWRCKGRADAHARAVRLFRDWLEHPAQAELRARGRDVFRGKRPACWCGADAACHGDVWSEIANPNPPLTAVNRSLP